MPMLGDGGVDVHPAYRIPGFFSEICTFHFVSFSEHATITRDIQFGPPLVGYGQFLQGTRIQTLSTIRTATETRPCGSPQILESLLEHENKLTMGYNFDNTGNMEIKNAIRSLAALAHNSRLEIFRLLVQKGPEGMAATAIAENVGLPNATLSFHVKALTHAGLVEARQDGRFIYYAANYSAMNDLVGYLTDNCCGGQACAPQIAAPKILKGERNETATRARRRA
jgi:DNA-binding transcriptional ArsR family regulator